MTPLPKEEKRGDIERQRERNRKFICISKIVFDDMFLHLYIHVVTQ